MESTAETARNVKGRWSRDLVLSWRGAVTALVVVRPVALCTSLAAFVADDGCAWIVGFGGCLPR